MSSVELSKQAPPKRNHPFRREVLRGLAVLLPPLLTIVIFVWIGNTINGYVLQPAKGLTRRIAVLTGHEELIAPIIDSWQFVVIFVGIFILVMYLLGRFLAAGVGRFAHKNFERVIHRLPLIRNVYGSVKQVTDFVFSESEVEYTRVVAVEYPRKGIWSLGLVTGDSMLDIRSAANEAVLSVLIPTSPAPFTGFTVTIMRSEAIDLNLTIDQAFQFIVSCGVVVPPHQMQEALEDGGVGELSAAPPAHEDTPASGDPALPTTGS